FFVTMGPRAVPNPGLLRSFFVTMGPRAVPNPGLLRSPFAGPRGARDRLVRAARIAAPCAGRLAVPRPERRARRVCDGPRRPPRRPARQRAIAALPRAR